MNFDRNQRLLDTFVGLLEDHRKDFEGFVRDIENVRFSHTPIDSQQINRCEYALRNMSMLLLTARDAIQSQTVSVEDRTLLVEAKNEWSVERDRVDAYLAEIHDIVRTTAGALGPIRDSMTANRR